VSPDYLLSPRVAVQHLRLGFYLGANWQTLTTLDSKISPVDCQWQRHAFGKLCKCVYGAVGVYPGAMQICRLHSSNGRL
jgi:hypothetical protein